MVGWRRLGRVLSLAKAKSLSMPLRRETAEKKLRRTQDVVLSTEY